MMTCLGRGQDASLPHQVEVPWTNGRRVEDTLDRRVDCGAPLQLLLDRNKTIQVNLARSFWNGVGDIKEAIVPDSLASITLQTPTFYIEGEQDMMRDQDLVEEDNFFEDMSCLYSQQATLFQRSCDQIRDLYRVDITPDHRLGTESPFGEVAREGGEELYCEVLSCLFHMIGADCRDINQFQLVEHLRKAFKIEPARHLQLYSRVEQQAAPQVKLSLCLAGAKDLVSKEIGGSSNPYCTFYVSSDKGRPKSTSCKARTLNPVWDETFTLDVVLDTQECLHLEVWSFEEGAGGETGLVDRLRRVGEVKDSRGLRMLVKDTVAPPPGDKLIGTVKVRLDSLPASGSNKWWELQKVDSGGKVRKERGEIQLIQHLFTRPHQLEEHTRLLKVLLSQELIKRNSAAYEWRDNFCQETLQVLAQHAVQCRLTRVDTALTRLLVYGQVHEVLPLDCRVFIPILEKLRKPVLASEVPEHQVKQFHKASEELVVHFTTFVRKHRLYVGNNRTKYQTQLGAILKSLHILHTLKWRTRNDIVLQVEDALLASVREWFNFVMDRIPSKEDSQGGKMKNLTRITHLLMADIEEGRKNYQDMFWETLNISYVEVAYREFDQSLTSVTRGLIDQACDKMKPIMFREEERVSLIRPSLTVGTQLFELYLALQQFYTLGFSVINKEKEEGKEDDFTVFHSWFIRAVAKWLDIALYKAMVRIVKAVGLDDLKPVDDLSHHSSSAVDLRTVLTQIGTFWTQLSWPDTETSYVFISRVMDDVCKAIIFYAEKMVTKAEQDRGGSLGSTSSLQVTANQCLAINNIDYVMSFINPFVSELGVEKVLSRLEEQKGDLVGGACRSTIRTLMKNSVENVENQILSVLEDVGSKMTPTIERFLSEGQVQSPSDRVALLHFLDENLTFLRSRLVAANFERVLSVMWAVSAQSLQDIVRGGVEKKKPAQFFVGLHETFKVLLNFYYGEKIPQDGSLQTTRRLLELFASDSEALVENFHRQRFAEQEAVRPGCFPLGSINVRLQRLGEHVRVQVLNCRHLKPLGVLNRSESGEKLNNRLNRSNRLNKSSHNLSMSTDQKTDFIKDTCTSLRLSVSEARALAHRTAAHGMCSPYVTVKVVPGRQGQPHLSKVTTNTAPSTLFPLFDQTFDLVLPPSLDTASLFLLFSVKDRGPLGDRLLLGEALVPLEQVGRSGQDCDLSDMEQIQLPLTRPGPGVVDTLTALETRRSGLSKETRKWLANQRKKLLL